MPCALTVSELHAAQREIDDGWILLFDKVVLCESFDMKDEIWRERSKVMPLERRAELLHQSQSAFSSYGQRGLPGWFSRRISQEWQRGEPEV